MGSTVEACSAFYVGTFYTFFRIWKDGLKTMRESGGALGVGQEAWYRLGDVREAAEAFRGTRSLQGGPKGAARDWRGGVDCNAWQTSVALPSCPALDRCVACVRYPACKSSSS